MYRKFCELSAFEKDIIVRAPREDVGELARRMNLNPNTLRARRSELKKSYEPNLPRNVITVREKPLHLETPNALILNDLHAPYHNREMLRRALVLTQRDFPHIRDVCIGGDLFNFDRISRWGNDTPASSVTQDLKKGREIVKELARIFDRVWVISGNHDQRLAKKLDAVVTMEDLLGVDAPAKVYCSDFEYMEIGDDWLLVHPRNYSGMGGKTPADIALLEHKNVVAAHNHVTGRQQSKCGRYLGIDSGHLTDPEQHFYLKSGMTTFARWNAGFVIISENYSYEFTERFTDWSRLLY